MIGSFDRSGDGGQRCSRESSGEVLRASSRQIGRGGSLDAEKTFGRDAGSPYQTWEMNKRMSPSQKSLSRV